MLEKLLLLEYIMLWLRYDINSLSYAKSLEMWWDKYCKHFIQFGCETEKLELSSGLFHIWSNLCKAGGARVFDQMTSNQVPVGPEYVLNHLQAHERNLSN